MKKKYIIRQNSEFNRIIKSIKPYRYKYLLFYVENTTENKYLFGFSIGKKIGNAVKRNKLKRQIKSITSKNDYQNGFNCIIMVNKGVVNIPYQQLKKDINESLRKLNLIK